MEIGVKRKYKYRCMKILSYAEEVSYLAISPLARKILEAIYEKNTLTPTLIAKTIGVSPSNVSTKLIELKEKGLVECVTPERRKGRLYLLTTKGKASLQIVRRITSVEKI